jgi:hypothetical protein
MKKTIKFLAITLFSFTLTVLSSQSYGSSFCREAVKSITTANPEISVSVATSLLNKLIADLKQGTPADSFEISANQHLPLQSLFVNLNLRSQRAFTIRAIDLKKIPEMQYKMDLIVLGEIDFEKVEKVKAAVKGTGIRIFPLTFSNATSDMTSLAQVTGASVIQIPTGCSL